mgnify:CR=1 FL=1
MLQDTPRKIDEGKTVSPILLGTRDFPSLYRVNEVFNPF